MQLPAVAISALLLVASNVFMTFAWYAHLKNLSAKPWWIAALASSRRAASASCAVKICRVENPGR